MASVDQQITDFLRSQVVSYEPSVYERQYPEKQYGSLVPIDTSSPEWTPEIAHYAKDGVGRMDWVAEQATDLPLTDVTRTGFSVPTQMAGGAYRWHRTEILRAHAAGVDIRSDKAMNVRDAYEDMLERTVLYGMRDTTAANVEPIMWDGLINAGIPAANSVTNTTGNGFSGKLWSAATADEILADINAIISGVWLNSLQMENANTLLMSPKLFVEFANKRIPGTDTTFIEYFRRANVTTLTGGPPLNISYIRGLDTAGTLTNGSRERLIAYRLHPTVLRFHLTMPLVFYPVDQVSDHVWEVRSYWRGGGLEIMKPGAFRYADGF